MNFATSGSSPVSDRHDFSLGPRPLRNIGQLP